MYIILYTIYSIIYMKSGEMLKLGNRIRQYRFEKGDISQQDLANAVGVTRLTIHSVETGKFNPSTLLALKIARYFNTKFEDLFYLIAEGEDNGKNG